jgi:AraC-like DNA-binding protein
MLDSGMQTYRERLPAPALAGVLSCVWVQRVSPDGPAYEHRTVPNGAIEIVCVTGTDTVSVVGPRTAHVLDRLDPGTTVVGARFRPGVPPAVIGATAHELLGREADLDVLWGAQPAARITAAGTPDAIERELVARLDLAPDRDPLVAETVYGLQPWRRRDIAELAGALYISPRQFRRRCIAAFGFGPKTLHRILRFQGFLALADRDRLGVGRLAAESGYFDQAHLARECLELTGMTPSAFLQELHASCGANHDHAASYAGLRRALQTAVSY